MKGQKDVRKILELTAEATFGTLGAAFVGFSVYAIGKMYKRVFWGAAEDAAPAQPKPQIVPGPDHTVKLVQGPAEDEMKGPTEEDTE